MACCAGADIDFTLPEGVCVVCGAATVGGQALEACAASETDCEECGHAYCDGAC